MPDTLPNKWLTLLDQHSNAFEALSESSALIARTLGPRGEPLPEEAVALYRARLRRFQQTQAALEAFLEEHKPEMTARAITGIH